MAGWQPEAKSTCHKRALVYCYGSTIKKGPFIGGDMNFYGPTHEKSPFYNEFCRRVERYKNC